MRIESEVTRGISFIIYLEDLEDRWIDKGPTPLTGLSKRFGRLGGHGTHFRRGGGGVLFRVRLGLSPFVDNILTVSLRTRDR